MTRNTRPRNCRNGADGGHSSFDQAMQVAEMAGVKRLALTHHDPDHDDEFLERIENCVKNGSPTRCLLREGMEIAI